MGTADWGTAMYTAAASALTRIMHTIPALLAALFIVAIGWLVGKGIGKAAAALLRRVGFQRFADRVGFTHFLETAGVRGIDASSVVGIAVNWVIRLVFIQMAAEAVGLRQVTVLLNQLIAFLPNVFVAALILMAASFFGRLLQGVVRGAGASAGLSSSYLLGSAAYWAVFAFGIIAALNQLQIAPVVVNTLFIGLVATLVLALGLSFGLGGREVAAELTRSWADRARALAPQARRAAVYTDPLTRPHPSEYDDEEHPATMQGQVTTPL
jgi:hypothetical protein